MRTVVIKHGTQRPFSDAQIERHIAVEIDDLKIVRGRGVKTGVDGSADVELQRAHIP